MKRYSAVVLVGASALAMAAPAQARDLYMVKDVENVNGVYIGEFATLAKKGTKVVGAVGAFSSEYFCVKGTVKNGRLRAKVYENGVPVTSFNRKWVGTGSKQRIKGMSPATYDDVLTYLEGADPRSFIRDCRSTT